MARNKSYLESGVRVKKPQNEAEAKCFDFMKEKGWTCTKRGWADFFCIRGEEVCCVEVKPHSGQRLKREQRVVMNALYKHGIPCYKWTPDKGLEEWKPEREDL